METNPLVPRQRNRRADRQSAEPPVQQTAQAQMAAQRPVYPQQPYAQSPRTMYQARPQQSAPTQSIVPTQSVAPAQPVRPAASYPQTQARYPQQAQRPVQPPTAQYAPRPKALEQQTTARSGWQQPTVREPAEVPHARASRGLTRENDRAARQAQRKAEPKAPEAAAPEKNAKLPGWLTTAMTLCFLGVLALVTAYWLMNAYLVTEEQKRVAAWEAVLDNYHVTEQADGTLRVTWQDAIETYAAQYNLQPAFVIAIIRNESSFRTNAESSVGARGLMQLMPDTAEWIAGKLDDDAYTFDDMYDAETNIRYGCWYLGYLSKLFHGDAELVSAAYHAGQTTVTQWLSDPSKSSDGVNLDVDNLSDGPTKQYIGRVTQTYGIYQSLLYPDEAFGAADAVSADGAAASADR